MGVPQKLWAQLNEGCFPLEPLKADHRTEDDEAESLLSVTCNLRISLTIFEETVIHIPFLIACSVHGQSDLRLEVFIGT